MYNELATANFLDELSEERRQRIIEAVYDCGLTWEEALTDAELARLRELDRIERKED